MTETKDTATLPPQLTKADQVAVFLRSGLEQASWNFERLQNLGFCYIMVPAIKRLSVTEQARSEALTRHLELFNTMPYMQSLITGVVLSMEEAKAAGDPVTSADINSVKVAMMGSLAGIGDPVWWGSLRPVLSAFAASLALSGFGIFGPLIFFVIWNLARLGFRGWGQWFGYHHGVAFINRLNRDLVQQITLGASIVGMFIMGSLVPRWTKVTLAPIVSDTTVHGVRKALSLQTILDQLLPGLVPLLLTLTAVWLLRRKVNPMWLILGLFVLGIGGYWLGLFR